ncbi:MAG: DUF3098 domain-containing protein [Bacteroidales bacterium]|jgi:hypothetical protein|nr:DUF3098 domain-containing protein [Bacteroidales bacterium]
MNKTVKKTTAAAGKAPVKPTSGSGKKSFDFAFERENYILMLIGLVVLAIGYLLMVGGGSEDPAVFNEDIFSFRRVVLSPIVIVAGMLIEVVAIMKKPKHKKNDVA